MFCSTAVPQFNTVSASFDYLEDVDDGNGNPASDAVVAAQA